MTHADFLKVGHFARFSQFLHIKGQNLAYDVLTKYRMCGMYYLRYVYT